MINPVNVTEKYLLLLFNPSVCPLCPCNDLRIAELIFMKLYIRER